MILSHSLKRVAKKIIIVFLEWVFINMRTYIYICKGPEADTNEGLPADVYTICRKSENEHLLLNILYEISRKRLISHEIFKSKCSFS